MSGIGRAGIDPKSGREGVLLTHLRNFRRKGKGRINNSLPLDEVLYGRDFILQPSLYLYK
jgi:hypothetical protein